VTAADDAAALVAFVRERDVECPLCRYNLRGLMTPRCPECGRELRLSIGLVEPRQGAWLLCQIATAAIGGIGLLAWLSILQNGWPDATEGTVIFNVCFLSFLIGPALAAAVFFSRRVYLRAARPIQWGLAIGACTIAVLGIGGMLFTNG
jgi:hypothetical protein